MTLLEMWVICERPSDHPNAYTCRRHTVTRRESRPDPACIVSPDIESIREAMRRRGLVCIARQENDDPVIVECWL